MARYIFVTGGVVSSLGKGLLSASLGALLQARGYKVRIRKFDPYLNVDPGTMSPYQHGEVYVTDDGAETDLDLGHYERFTGVSSRQSDNITTGRIYRDIIAKERRGQVGTGERSEKIRTYNFPQNRITDHRINFTTHQLYPVLDGNLSEIIDALTTYYTAEKLKEATEDNSGADSSIH